MSTPSTPAAGAGDGGTETPSTSSAAVKVVVRVRPFNGREIKKRSKGIISMVGNQTFIQDPSRTGEVKKFTFDHSFWSAGNPATLKLDERLPDVNAEQATQAMVFDACGQDVITHAADGFNVSLFAYGQTGSGKSYSMMGAGSTAVSADDKSHTTGVGGATASDNPNAGLIPRISTALFQFVRANEIVEGADMETATAAADGNVFKLFKVEVSYIEIYNEKVKDLLSGDKSGKPLRVREDPKLGPFVDGLTKLTVAAVDELFRAIEDGNAVRTVAATAMNAVSSRSHAVFTVVFTQTTVDPGRKMATDKVSKINLVDLAGSERADSTGATGARLKEGSMINKSLTTLGRVIAALAKASSSGGKAPFVPYRDSVLTLLLKESLGGNSRTTMIAAIAPASVNYDETLSTLRYADQAKRIVNKAVVNEDPTTRLIRELREEIASLRKELTTLRSSPAGQASDASASKLEGQLARATGLASVLASISEAPAAPDAPPAPDSPTSAAGSPVATPVASGVAFVGLRDALAARQTQQKRRARRQSVARSASMRGAMGGAVARHGSTVDTSQLTNLNPDPMLSECLVYPLLPGTTFAGSDKAACQAAAGGGDDFQFMELQGVEVAGCHCQFHATEGGVTVEAVDGAALRHNGMEVGVGAAAPLAPFDRLRLGATTYMKYLAAGVPPRPESAHPKFDWQFAHDECTAIVQAAEARDRAASVAVLEQAKAAAEAEAEKQKGEREALVKKFEASSAAIEDELKALREAKANLDKEKAEAEAREAAAKAEKADLLATMEAERDAEAKRRAEAEEAARKLAAQHAEERAKEQQAALTAASETEREALKEAARASEEQREAAAKAAEAQLAEVKARAEKAEAARLEAEGEAAAKLKALQEDAHKANEALKTAQEDAAGRIRKLEEDAANADAQRKQAQADLERLTKAAAAAEERARTAEQGRAAAETKAATEAANAQKASALVQKELDKVRAQAVETQAQLEKERAAAATREAEARAEREALQQALASKRAEEAASQAKAEAEAAALATRHAAERAEEERQRAAAASEAERAALQAKADAMEEKRAMAAKEAETAVSDLRQRAEGAEEARRKAENEAMERVTAMEAEAAVAESHRQEALAQLQQERAAAEARAKAAEEARIADAERAKESSQAVEQQLAALKAQAEAAEAALEREREEAVKREAEAVARATEAATRASAAPPSPAPATPPSAPSTIHEGFLRKQGGSRTAWKRRWVRLEGGTLCYAKARGSQWVGEVPLAGTQVFMRPDSLSEDPFVFHIATPTRLYFFQATSKVEVESWVSALANFATRVDSPDADQLKRLGSDKEKCAIC